MYDLAPEWAPQQATLLTWPHSTHDWQPILSEIEALYINLVNLIADHQDIFVVCYDDAHQKHVQTLIADKAKTLIAKTNDTWIRDNGPITVFDGQQKIALDFQFNGWGEKYRFDLDNALNQNLFETGLLDHQELHPIDFVLEGGSIDVNGEGTLLTTSRCFNARHKNISPDVLKTFFNINNIVALENGGLVGDDTDGHIDNLARFTDPETICYLQCDQRMKAELKSLKQFRLVPLPMPKNTNNIPASYANFLIINGAVIVPTFNDPSDELALKQLQTCFPDRNIIGMNALPLVQQCGGIHCATMQVAA